MVETEGGNENRFKVNTEREGEIVPELCQPDKITKRKYVTFSQEICQDDPASYEPMFYKKLVEKASHIPGDQEDVSSVGSIPWINCKLIRIGQTFVRENFAVFMCSFFVSMYAFVFSVKPVASLIFRNEQAIQPLVYYKRFISKTHEDCRLVEDLLNVSEEHFYKLLYKIRKMHRLAVKRHDITQVDKTLPEMIENNEKIVDKARLCALAKALREDAKLLEQIYGKANPNVAAHIGWDCDMPFSQFSMAYLTLLFFLPIWLNPEKFGIHGGRDEIQMKGLIHCWAVIAKAVGLLDEYNIFIEPNHNEIFGLVVRDVYVPSLRNMDWANVFVQQLTFNGIQMNSPFSGALRPEAMNLVGLWLLGGKVKDGKIWRMASFKDKVWLGFFQALFWLTVKMGFVRRLANVLMSKIILRMYKCAHPKKV